MKKYFFSLMASFFCCVIVSQATPIDSHNTDNNTAAQDTAGIWLFEKAGFTAYQYGTESVVETINIDKVSALDTAGFHFETVFREIEISGGQIFVILGNRYRNNQYQLEDDRLISLKSGEKSKNDNSDNFEELPSEIMLQPYLYSRNGDKIQFTFKYSYGDSRYDFSLEGRLLITYIKSNKTNN